MNGKVAAVIVGFNSPDELRRMIQSVDRQTCKINTLILIDNSDKANSAANRALCIEKLGHYKKIIYCSTIHNIGSAGGFALGMHLAHNDGADWIWLNDQDGEPERHCLEKLLEAAERKNRIAIYVPRIFSHENNYLEYFRAKQNFLGNNILIKENSLKSIVSIDVAGTTGMLISSAIVDRCGYYDYKNFFVGMEDIEYCHRVKKRGYPIYLINDTVYKHPDISSNYKIGMHSHLGRFSPKYFGYDHSYCRGVAYINFTYNREFFLISLIYSIMRLIFDRIKGHNFAILKVIALYFDATRITTRPSDSVASFIGESLLIDCHFKDCKKNCVNLLERIK